MKSKWVSYVTVSIVILGMVPMVNSIDDTYLFNLAMNILLFQVEDQALFRSFFPKNCRISRKFQFSQSQDAMNMQ